MKRFIHPDSPSPIQGNVRIAPATDTPDLGAFVQVYRRAFGYAEAGLNVRLLSAIQRNGGIVLGAWVGDEPAGLVFGFVAHAPDVGFYHYSQAAAVDVRFQGLGIGRLLKLAQRERVRAQGLTRMRWYFDPLRSRNAHFNLDVLGADAVALERNLYGPGAGRDTGFPTHRLVADWALDRDPVSVESSRPGGGERITIPDDWEAYRSSHPEDAPALAERVASAFAAAFERRLRAIALHRTGGAAHYLLSESR